MSVTAYANETKIKNFLYFSDHCFPSNTQKNNSNLVLELLPFFSFLSWKLVSSAEKKNLAFNSDFQPVYCLCQILIRFL